MFIAQAQIDAIGRTRGQDFVSRLDPLLCAHSDAYAALERQRRTAALLAAVAHAQRLGIAEELNIGLFVLALIVFGQAALRQPEPQAILDDANRSGTAKVYQLWHWCRQQHPQAAIFAPEPQPI